MNKQEVQMLKRLEARMARLEARQCALNELFNLHIGDAEHISDLQRKLNDANEKIRELETDQYFERKARKQ